MTEAQYNYLKYTAIIMAISWVGWSLYDFMSHKQPGDFAYHAGTTAFADGYYDRALVHYREALEEVPNHLPARRGMAETLILLGREQEAITIYDELLELDPDNAGFLANRAIALDRIGEHEQALENYRSALNADTSINKGPNWLTRFFRNQPERPPGLAERAAYIQAQLDLPEEQRVLSLPEADEAQRPYRR